MPIRLTTHRRPSIIATALIGSFDTFPVGSATVSSRTQSAHSRLHFIVRSRANTGHSWAEGNS
jgi:hypothetical protein